MKKAILNVLCLTAIQASNAALPLIVFPFALGAVGDLYYSKLVVSEAMVVFLLAVVLYSFEIDGVAGVVGADPKTDRLKLSTMLCGVVITRLLLFCSFLPVLVAIAWFMDKQLVLPVLAWSLVTLSYAVQPNWFFQGLGQNAVVAIVAVVTRGCAVAGTMLLVDDPSKYMRVPLCIGISYLVGAIVVLAYAFVKYRLAFRWPGLTHLRSSLVNGRYIFFGNLGVALYRDANVLVLASLGSTSSVISAYSLAEKLVKSIQAAIRPLNQHFFPLAMKIAQEKGVPRRSVWLGLFRLTLPQLAALSCVVVVLYAMYPWARVHISIVRNIANLDEVLPILGIMCIGALFGVANFMFGSAGMNAMGEQSYLFSAILLAGVIGVVTCAIAGHYLGAYGAAIAFVAAEGSLQIAILRKYFEVEVARGKQSWK